MLTTVVLLETVLLAVLTVLVVGLLRAYATVLRRLHAIDGGAHGPTEFAVRPAAPLDDPQARDEWAAAHDVAGVTPGGEAVVTRVVGAPHDTVLLFLSSGCTSCAVFWSELAEPARVRLPQGVRLLVVAQDADADSPAALADLTSPGLDVVLSGDAWRDYEVPGSPYVVLVDGRTGRVRGEGTGQSWQQVEELLARATGDVGFVADRSPSLGKPRSDREREADADRELLAAGIVPGDPRLYQAPDAP